MERRRQEERGGGYYRRLQEVGPYTGGNVNRCLKVRPVQETEGEACTEGGASTGVERRGLYRRWCEAVQEGVRKACCPFCLKMINWIGGGHTGEYLNSMWFRLRWTYRRISE